MRKALMAAQKMADDLVREAEQKKAEILSRAESEVRTRRAGIDRELEAEAFRLKKAQQETAAYVDKVRALHAKEAEYLSQLEELVPPDTTPAPDPVEEKAAEIDDNVQRLLAQAMEAAAAENLRARAEEEDDDERDMSDTAEFTPGLSPEEDEEEDYPDPEDEDGPPAGSTSRIDFGSLQFGRDYEIT